MLWGALLRWPQDTVTHSPMGLSQDGLGGTLSCGGCSLGSQSLDNPLTTTPPLVETCAPSQPGCTPIYRADFWGSLDPSSPVPFGEGLRLSGEGLRAEHTLQAREHSSGKAHWEGRATVRRNLPLTAQAVPGHMLHPQELAQG